MATIRQQMQLRRGLVTTEIVHAAPFYVVRDRSRRGNLSYLGCRFHGQDAHIESSAIGRSGISRSRRRSGSSPSG